ncbi:unnamed protein product, partial [Cuscuta europaea]
MCGIPCAHAICAIYDKEEEAESYVDWCYSKEVYKKTYSYTLHPINGELLWPRTQFEEILPPLPKKMSGRPKKKRVSEETEPRPPTGSQLPRIGRIMTCSKCKGEGHNMKSCTATDGVGMEATPSTSTPAGAGIVGAGATGRRPRGCRGKKGNSRSREQSGFGVFFMKLRVKPYWNLASLERLCLDEGRRVLCE